MDHQVVLTQSFISISFPLGLVTAEVRHPKSSWLLDLTVRAGGVLAPGLRQHSG